MHAPHRIKDTVFGASLREHDPILGRGPQHYAEPSKKRRFA
jgi:hypothetical protein